MGVDRHELEHRNWRSSTSGKAPARDASSEDSELSIVPDDVIAANADLLDEHTAGRFAEMCARYGIS